MMGYWDYGYNNMGFGVLGVIVNVFIWMLIIALFVGILRRVFYGRHGRWSHGCGPWCCHGHHEGGRAMDILKERYAKGEIDKREYDEKKEELSK